ncbi:hypothetical protein DSM112329_04820 [Paraconexibacter sp. AEG42_29]|uniref:LTXXQ motif family protein n=1 Tax=Paraconexibacter sp. AEG42_29 TaxID=2997339 RepID=A0AAU7B235_9ACTN
MSRRLIASLSLVVCALLAATTIAIASSGGSSSSSSTAAAAAPGPAAAPVTSFAGKGKGAHGGRGFGHGGAMFGMFRGMLLKSGAERLGVTPDKLKAAVTAVAEAQFAKKTAEAKLTAAELAALKSCHRGFAARRGAPGKQGKATCDRAAVKSAFDKLKALPKPDLAALKTELSDALGKELGITGAKVLEAARAELSARLDQGVKMGFVTAGGKAKALACFDGPATCDVKALKREVFKGHRFGGHGKQGFRGRGHGGRRFKSAPATSRSGRQA